MQHQGYGLRSRIPRRAAGPAFGDAAIEANPKAMAAAIATISAGLRMGEMTPSERRAFARKVTSGEYLSARCRTDGFSVVVFEV